MTAEQLEDPLYVRPHCMPGNPERFCDLRISASLRKQQRNLGFARAETESFTQGLSGKGVGPHQHSEHSDRLSRDARRQWDRAHHEPVELCLPLHSEVDRRSADVSHCVSDIGRKHLTCDGVLMKHFAARVEESHSIARLVDDRLDQLEMIVRFWRPHIQLLTEAVSGFSVCHCGSSISCIHLYAYEAP